MIVHSCPWCRCGIDRAPLTIDVTAPGYGLVVEADRIIYDDYITRRTAKRKANAAARRTELAEVA